MATEKNNTAEELKAENQELKARLAAAEATQKDGKPRIVGKVTLEIEDPESGKQKAAYEFVPGHPNVRYNAQIVPSQAIMDAANGKSNPLGIEKQDALSFLANAAAKGAGWLQKVGAVLLLMLAFTALLPMTADAQINNGRFYSFDRDTTTNTETIYFTFPFDLNSNVEFDYAWQLTSTNVSGTSTANAYVQESLDGTNWINVDTIAVSGSGSHFETGYTIGVKQRMAVTSSGTGVTDLVAVVRFRKKQ